MLASSTIWIMRFLLLLYIYRLPHEVSTSEILSNGCNDAPTEAVHPDHILYNKVPKCGSTTLQNIFEVVAESTNMTVTLQFIYHGINMNPPGQEKFVKQISNLKKGTLLHRHVFLPDFHRFNEEYPSLINIIRDPVDRLISNFYYMRELYAKRRGIEVKHFGMDFEKCVRRGGCLTKNGALDYFCGQDRMCRTIGPEALARAKYNVCKYYDTVGVMEDMRGFVEVLQHLYPGLMSGIVDVYDETVEKFHSQSSTTSRKEPNPETIALLKHELRYQYDFYYFVKDRFSRQYDTIMKKYGH